MNTKHTPGPWMQEGNSVWGGERQCELIAEINGKGRITGGEKHLKANTRLIAAAPDLLAAIQTLANHHEADIRSEYEGTGLLDGKLRELEPAYAAIRKAIDG